MGKIKKLLSKAKSTKFEIRLIRLLSLLSSPKSEVNNSPDPTPHKEPPPLDDYSQLTDGLEPIFGANPRPICEKSRGEREGGVKNSAEGPLVTLALRLAGKHANKRFMSALSVVGCVLPLEKR